MKVVAFYLPQFHEIEENNKWWGKGFTEWTNVKKAVPLFPDHQQPMEPLNDNYYSLDHPDVMRWQTDIAKRYGIFGFCFYHCWYPQKTPHTILEKPVEMFLQNHDIDFHYCLSWVNESWTKAWIGKETEILLKQTYGDWADWEDHFMYLLPFFKDVRYIKINEKPLFIIYRPEKCVNLDEMMECMDNLAIDNGFPGLCFAFQQVTYQMECNNINPRFDYNIEYQPAYVFYKKGIRVKIEGKIKKYKRIIQSIFSLEERKKLPTLYNYDVLWKRILRMNPTSNKAIPGSFICWDNTPRKQGNGSVTQGFTTEKFRTYMSQQIKRAREVYKKEFLFIFAWNEWAEGGILEPTKKYGFSVLEAIKSALEENGEFPEELLAENHEINEAMDI